MYIDHLECGTCHRQYPRTKLIYRCDCGGSLEILYDLLALKKKVSWKKLRARRFSHWRYEEFFPHCTRRVSLGEGGTPLVESAQNPRLLFKMEQCNPTGSFKDRGSTVELSHALDGSARGIACASTGNMGASVAAYSARAGLPCKIFLPQHAAGPKIEQIRACGATISQVKGDYTLAMNTAYRAYQQGKAFLVGDYAFRGEGEKSVGYEIIDELLAADRSVGPLIVPIGNGTLLSGIWKGLKELKAVGLLHRLPKLVGVQAKGCAPVARAFESGKQLKPIKNPKTIAGAVACGDPLDGHRALLALQESGGEVVTLTDRQIFTYQAELATLEGIDAEYSGVLSYGAWKELGRGGRAIAVITGHGLKNPL